MSSISSFFLLRMSKSSSRSSKDRSSGTEKKKKERSTTSGKLVRLETGGGRSGWEAPGPPLAHPTEAAYFSGGKQSYGHQPPRHTSPHHSAGYPAPKLIIDLSRHRALLGGYPGGALLSTLLQTVVLGYRHRCTQLSTAFSLAPKCYMCNT